MCAGVMMDVSKAQRLVDRRKRPGKRVRLSVKGLRKFIRRGYIGVNLDHARSGELQTRPLLAVNVCGIITVFDGWHRVWRAHRQGRTWLYADVLTELEARQCAMKLERCLK